MDINEISAAWATAPDMTTDASNDYAERGDSAEAAQRNARNVEALKGKAECGHCGRIVNIRTRAASKHVIACELANRPYQFGRDR